MSEAGEIPQSDALTAVPTDTLSELFSRDPLGLGRQDIDKIIVALREQRQRLANAAGEVKPRAARAAAGELKSRLGATKKVLDKSVGDLGL